MCSDPPLLMWGWSDRERWSSFLCVRNRLLLILVGRFIFPTPSLLNTHPPPHPKIFDRQKREKNDDDDGGCGGGGGSGQRYCQSNSSSSNGNNYNNNNNNNNNVVEEQHVEMRRRPRGQAGDPSILDEEKG